MWMTTTRSWSHVDDVWRCLPTTATTPDAARGRRAVVVVVVVVVAADAAASHDDKSRCGGEHYRPARWRRVALACGYGG